RAGTADQPVESIVFLAAVNSDHRPRAMFVWGRDEAGRDPDVDHREARLVMQNLQSARIGDERRLGHGAPYGFRDTIKVLLVFGFSQIRDQIFQRVHGVFSGWRSDKS